MEVNSKHKTKEPEQRWQIKALRKEGEECRRQTKPLDPRLARTGHVQAGGGIHLLSPALLAKKPTRAFLWTQWCKQLGLLFLECKRQLYFCTLYPKQWNPNNRAEYLMPPFCHEESAFKTYTEYAFNQCFTFMYHSSELYLVPLLRTLSVAFHIFSTFHN